jgi:long-chain acyl-CoA synthetase
MIVRADGMNIFPEDVERVLNAQPGVIESAVVGFPSYLGGEEPMAVLRLEPGTEANDVLRAANLRLEPHQRVLSATRFDAPLPRTEGTKKLRRLELQKLVMGERPPAPKSRERVMDIVSAAVGGRKLRDDTRFDELGLGSLERMQLLARVEEAYGTSIDEGEFAAAATIGQLQRLVEHVDLPAAPVEKRARKPRTPVPDIRFPTWNQSLPIRAIRRVSLPTWVLSISRPWMKLTVEGLENLEGLDHPVIFAPNHQSHMDTPAVLQALPAKWRYRVSPAMAKEWFKAHFFPEDFPAGARVRNTAAYLGATIFYNAFPIPQYEAGARQTIRYIGTLFDQKRSLLIFPEGKRTDHGEIAEFRPGVGLMAAKLGVPVVPVRIEGLDKVLHLTRSWPTRGPVRITFGKPLRLEGSDYRALAARVREAVVALQPYSEPSEVSMAQ